MKKYFLLFWILCITRLLSASVQQIGPDLYAYVSSNDASANSTFLVSDKGILVVDTGLNAEEGRKLLSEIRQISSAPVRWIVNTHYHPDHRGGNATVGPDAIVISTRYTRDQALAMASGREAIEATSYSRDVVVEKELTLFVGIHEVRIFHPGPAHTKGDLVVYFPDERAISTGDLFLTNSCPAMDNGDMENWIAALDHMLGLRVEHVVPGHFEVASKAELGRFRNYLAGVREQVRAMTARGDSFDQVKKNLHLEQFSNFRQYPQYEATFADNAAEYYRELQARSSTPSRH
jgi:cyclase